MKAPPLNMLSSIYLYAITLKNSVRNQGTVQMRPKNAASALGSKQASPPNLPPPSLSRPSLLEAEQIATGKQNKKEQKRALENKTKKNKRNSDGKQNKKEQKTSSGKKAKENKKNCTGKQNKKYQKLALENKTKKNEKQH